MAQFGMFHNGTCGVPQKYAEDGTVIPDASLEEIHDDAKDVMKDQVQNAVTADKAGIDRLFLTEHHFQPTGSEHSPNPLQTEAYIAAKTENIRLCQATNVITWHDPVRMAEQAAILDILSDGRAEIGVGRGYQPRENEVLGQYWGGTIQDQEKNRVSFEEKVEILKKAWTEDAFSYHGEYHSIPPKHTKWHHNMDRALWEDDVTEESLDEMIDWDEEGDFYSNLWNPVVSGGSKLKQISVFPQPLQKPHPQLWEPLTTPRSIEWAAKNGVNGVMNVEPNSRFANNVELYMEAAEEAGWPDHRPEYDGEEFEYGWDEERGRGIVTTRWIFNTDVHGDGEVLDRWKKGLENGWAFYGPFGFAAVLAEGDEELYDPSEPVDADTVIDKDVAIVGDTDTIRDKCAKYKEETGLSDFNMVCWFETAGFTADEADEQIEHFGENVIPYIEEEFPGPKSAAVADD